MGLHRLVAARYPLFAFAIRNCIHPTPYTTMKHFSKLCLALAAVLPCSAVFACASCGCTLNSDFGSQGLSTASGWSLDLRYDTLNQNQLRRGTGTLSATEAANVTNPASNATHLSGRTKPSLCNLGGLI